MIPSDVEPISRVYASESVSGGEQAIGASGTGDGGDPSRAEGELVEGPEVEEAQQLTPMPSPTLPSQSERMVHRITHLPYCSWCDVFKHSAVSERISRQPWTSACSRSSLSTTCSDSRKG